MEQPIKVFISYSWDSDEHKEWVKQLADRLMADGIDITLDQYDLLLGRNLTHYMEEAVETANKVILILTENYKLKAEKRTGGVGYEYS
ncbi:MAG: toll/interleukin-1 receptor domain-containing protein, partial [Bacteroidota bacterium]